MKEAFQLMNDTLGNLGAQEKVSEEEFLYHFNRIDNDDDRELDRKEIAQFLIKLRCSKELDQAQMQEICQYIDFEGG